MALAPDPAVPSPRLLPMAAMDVDAVHAIESASQAHPWTRGMFDDCLRAGYSGWVLRDEVTPPAPSLMAFALTSLALDEAHLLNLAVAPAYRRRGYAGLLLEHVIAQARAAEARVLLLEVRASNAPAISLYAQVGFTALARRPRYYPAKNGLREDALIMQCALSARSID